MGAEDEVERQVSRYWWRTQPRDVTQCSVPLKPGHTCPECGEGKLGYDSLFMLTCPGCGYVAETGTFT